MTTQEARAWLNGERSTINLFMETCSSGNENANLITAQADAAMMQQAYWVLLAEKDDLLDPIARLSGDGTDRLCMAVYGRPAKPRDYIGGANARMLYDAADMIESLHPNKDMSDAKH